MAHYKSVDILLVEDNEGDAELAREALTASMMNNNLFWVDNGEKAVDFVNKKGEYTEMPRPDLIILDLNLPRMDGREVLKYLKNHEDFKSIPIVILTTSSDEIDVLKSYKLHANCYITKPLDLDRFIDVVESIKGFWLSIVKLPNGG